jgi:hypothetical protein
MSAAAVERPTVDETKSPEWLDPKQDWHRKDYEFALFHMIMAGDTDGEKRITDAFNASEDGKVDANR